ncbi:MAG: ABC transporter permease subunit, partial [Rhodobacteraceae bacterium]|nr:ABC transporter permease subunit [Paracoccaceae bacterium]
MTMTQTDLANAAESNVDPTPVVLGPWALVWRKFRRHRLAMVSAVVVIFIYLVAIFAEFLAPFPTDQTSVRHTFAPPQPLALFVTDEDGTRFQPHVKGLKMEIDREAMRRSFAVDEQNIIPVGFFVKGYEYKLLGFIPANRHFFGPLDPRDPMYLWGADRLGRDMFSRIVMGTRVSMSIGLVGVAVSLIIGVAMGGLSGYYGGWVDTLIQRFIEFIRSVPTIPLWMGLAAAIPLDWPPLRTYFVVTVIVSMLGLTILARELRAQFLSL